MVAEEAESNKHCKYDHLSRSFPLAFETLGAIGPGSMSVLKEIGHSSRSSSISVLTALTVTIQRANAAAIVSSIGPLACMDDL